MLSQESIDFSLIVPTRKRPRQLRTLLTSIARTVESPPRVEVVLVVDDDDPGSLKVTCNKVSLKHVVVSPGLTMGALNSAGCRRAAGRYLMLLNDDVICRTRAWDAKVRACFQACDDEMLLIHVNDTLMETALCTFPIVSRAFCEIAGGLCPHEYRRYRIDDHVEDVFNLLGALGEQRTLYLPNVIFEHQNYVIAANGMRQYFADDAPLGQDASTFERLLPQRKELAMLIMSRLHRCAGEATEARWRAVLDSITDSFALRAPDRLREVTSFRPRSMAALGERIRTGIPGPSPRPRRMSSLQKCISIWHKLRSRKREVGYSGLAKILCRRARALLSRARAR